MIHLLKRKSKAASLFHDDRLAKMAEIAHELDAKAYAGGWVQLLNYDAPEQTAYPFTKNTFTTAANIVPPQRKFIPANTLHVGSAFQLHAFGSISSAAGTATFTPGIYLDDAPTTVMAQGAAQTPVTTTVSTWHIDAWATVLTIGSTGTIICTGQSIGIGPSLAFNAVWPPTSPAAVTIDTTVAHSFTIGAAWSVSAAGNTTSCWSYTVKQMN